MHNPSEELRREIGRMNRERAAARKEIQRLQTELGAARRQYDGCSSALTKVLTELTEARAEAGRLRKMQARAMRAEDALKILFEYRGTYGLGVCCFCKCSGQHDDKCPLAVLNDIRK